MRKKHSAPVLLQWNLQAVVDWTMKVACCLHGRNTCATGAEKNLCRIRCIRDIRFKVSLTKECGELVGATARPVPLLSILGLNGLVDHEQRPQILGNVGDSPIPGECIDLF